MRALVLACMLYGVLGAYHIAGSNEPVHLVNHMAHLYRVGDDVWLHIALHDAVSLLTLADGLLIHPRLIPINDQEISRHAKPL